MPHMLQDRNEFMPFCELMQKENVNSYLEIGSFYGGSIEFAAAYFPVGARIVSIDAILRDELRSSLSELKRVGYDMHLIIGNSAEESCLAKARELGPYDAIFIDGDHSFAGVSKDWENYGPLARIVGFHDVASDNPALMHGASALWNQIKPGYRHVEFISDATRARADGGFGIGVIYRA